jgi:hypothetical protein
LWREEHPEEYRVRVREDYQRRKAALAAKRNDPDAIEAKRLYDKGYRSSQGEKLRVKKQKYYSDNRETLAAKSLEYYYRKKGELDGTIDS